MSQRSYCSAKRSRRRRCSSCSRFDQLHRGFQVCPRGQQNHGEVGLLGAQRAEQGRALFAGGRVGAEIHVRDDKIDAFVRQDGQPLLRGKCRQGADVMQTEQQDERLGDCRVVIDDEDRTHGVMLTGAARNHTPTAVIPRESPMRGEWKPLATPATIRQIAPAAG